MAKPSQSQIAKAVADFVNAQTWDECHRIVEAERDKLLTDSVDDIFARLIESYKSDTKITESLEQRRGLLVRCRHDGIETVFADYLALEEVQTLLDESEYLTRPEDIPRLVEVYQSALQLVNRNTQIELWVYLHSRLAESLIHNPTGEWGDNLEQAIHHYEQALTVFTPQTSPEDWATTRYNLGIAYLKRMRGERADNLEQAISHLKQALQVYKRHTFPVDWARTQYGLALAYHKRIQGERAENLEQAISHYEQALLVYTRQAFPQDWAGTQYNLASVYSVRIQGERADNLEQAISHLEQALQVYKRHPFPEDWARAQYHLASAYSERLGGERADNLEQAISHLKQALQVFTRPAFPVAWVRTQNNLGNAYGDRIRWERADNLEQAISHYQLAFEVYTRQAFPVEWAGTQYNLAGTYSERIRGKRADNLEQAILHYEQALQVYKRHTFPEDWARTQHNLGIAYKERIRGERADNLEHAIRLYEQALAVYTRQVFPVEWATVQINLGNAYRERIHGKRADNLEQAISHLKQALQVFTRPAFPVEWASTQHNLGNAYGERIRGKRADNLEQAISHYQQTLQVNTRQAFPKDWATTQNNLATAYLFRIRGERADNLEQAISHYQQTLQVHTRQAFPVEWAKTQNNLASAYLFRIRGERADNLEQAISHYQLAFKVYTRQNFPEDWARTQNNLGNAYHERTRGERADNLEQAISHLEQALQVYKRHTFPEDWARTQNNLGNAYGDRIRGKRADNLEQAISHYEQALQVYKRHTFPEDWARTQHNLAGTYSERIQGERADNLEQAISHYQLALKVRMPLTFPQDCRDTSYLLGLLLYNEHRFSEARNALDTAHQAVEALRGEVQRGIAKRSLAEENAYLYACLVSCCLREGDEAAALAYVIAGKGRAFVDLLATERFDLSTASTNDPALAEDLRKAQELRQQIDTLLALLTGERGAGLSASGTISAATHSSVSLPPDTLRAQLVSLQVQETHQWDEMAYKYPALTATQKAPVLSVDQAHALAAELNVTLVEYYCHMEGWCAFVVTTNAMHYVPLPLLTDDLLMQMVTWIVRLEYPVGRNRLSYPRLSEWYDAVIAPLEAYLPPDQPVVLAPFGTLHVLPLTAARHRQTGRYLAQDYQLAFIPSLSALYAMRNQASLTGEDGHAVPQRLLSVAYPGTPDSDHYLPNVLPEAQAIAKHFTQVTKLYQEEATPEAILGQSHNQDVVHFGCHGWFDTERPEQSGLMLAGGWLTVQRIITELRLEQTRLATLGACLSGRAALQRGDEHVGLLQAMLTTGAKAVVSSLWPVDDAATRVLFETFYAELIAGRSPASAMQEAARRVREHPGWEHPYYWAAFQVSGLAHGWQEKEKFPVDQLPFNSDYL